MGENHLDAQELAAARNLCRKLQENIARVMVGKPEAITLSLIPLLCRGHLLLEDVPGVGKTTLAKAIARSIGGTFRRIQFTPDLLPLDVTGSSIFNQQNQAFEFREGPIFANVILADEINRATPRTQASLLECMEEFQVTVDGVTRPLRDVFFVMATQNPIEHVGTFPLPETQLDRFLLRLRIGYPRASEEVEIFDRQAHEHPLDRLEPVADPAKVKTLCRAIARIYIDPQMKAYAASIVRATRDHPDVRLGASPRGTLALIRASQAYALLSGMDFVTPDVVKEIAPAVLGHRILLNPGSHLRGITGEDVVRNILAETPVPAHVPERA